MMIRVIISSVLFVLLAQQTIVHCQIRIRPSQLKLTQIGGYELESTKTSDEKEQGKEKSKPLKVPAFVVTKIDEKTSPEIFSDYGPDEPKIPVLMAVKQTDQRRIKNSMVNSESKKQEVKVNPQKFSTGSKLPYPVETLEEIINRSFRRDQSKQNKKDHKYPIYKDSDRTQEQQQTTTTQPPTTTVIPDEMVHGSAEAVPSVALPSKVIPVKKSSERMIPVIVGYRRPKQEDSMETSESTRRNVYRLPAESTDVYTIENLLYGDRRPMHSNSIFYQKALSYLKQYRRAILQHRSYPERMIDEETPKELIKAYDPMLPLIHMQQGPTVPGGYQTSRGDNGYGRNDNAYGRNDNSNSYGQQREEEQRREQETEQVRESEDRSQEVPRDAIPIQDGDHNVIGFLPVISLRGGSGSSSSSSYGGGSSYGGQTQSNNAQSSLRKPLSPSLKLQNLLRSTRKGPRGEKTIPLLTMGYRQRY